MNKDMVKISIYINESDQWQNRPLHLEVLDLLHRNGFSGGTVLYAVAGFTNKGSIATEDIPPPKNTLSKLPLVVEFIEKPEKIEAMLPEIKRMVGPRLILREAVEILSYL